MIETFFEYESHLKEYEAILNINPEWRNMILISCTRAQKNVFHKINADYEFLFVSLPRTPLHTFAVPLSLVLALLLLKCNFLLIHICNYQLIIPVGIICLIK